MISLVVNFEWSLHQLDVKNAFVYGKLSEEVYTKWPPRFVTQGRVCKLNKTTYGLKQSPQTWFDTLSSTFLSFGFGRCVCDHSIFGLKRNTSIVVLIVYVNDIIVSSSDVASIEKVKSYFKKTF